jgi:hypothetical protein
MRFLWRMIWICICYVEESGPPLWSGGETSCLQIQRAGFDYRRFLIFWEVMGLERCPLCLVSTIEELLEWESSGSGIETENTDVVFNLADHEAQKLALTSQTFSGVSFFIVLLRPRATEFFYKTLSGRTHILPSLVIGCYLMWFQWIGECTSKRIRFLK